MRCVSPIWSFMARRFHTLSFRTVRIVAVFSLCLGACPSCMVPPPEVQEEENLPPWVDWTVTFPASDDLIFERFVDSRQEFRIEDAVFDPEGDSIDIVWYWESDNDPPTPIFGDQTMEMSPCDIRSLANSAKGSAFSVKVLVSDGALTWTGDPDAPLPVRVEEGHQVSKRIWLVTLLGECPQ